MRQHRLAGFITVTGICAAVAAGFFGVTPAAAQAASGNHPSAKDSAAEAAFVADEDRRLVEIRSVTAVAPLQDRNNQEWRNPYRLATGSGYTLVLTQRRTPYTISDLLTLAPQTFQRQADGSYLLSENIYLNAGAKLHLSNPGGLSLRLASNGTGFVSIVSFGGELTMTGTTQAPMHITSWDPRVNKPDTTAADGRAYIRAIGGQFAMDHVKASDLGFWSGRTGGISLTGTDRPNTGSTQSEHTHLDKSQRHKAKDTRLNGPAKPSGQPSDGGVTAMPAGPLGTPDTRFNIPTSSYVSAKITDSTISGNAYGLFISSANGILVNNTAIDHSLLDGLVLHRFASNAVVQHTSSNNNGGNGFILARAAQQIQVNAATASHNGGDGFLVTGRALAEGPSPAGEPIGDYGNNSIVNSIVVDNMRYGIEVVGGVNIGIQSNRVEGSDMGIVARDSASHVNLVGNQLKDQHRQGISIRDGVSSATVTGNIVDGAPTGIYLRDSVASIRGNTIQGASSHGVSVVGNAGGTDITNDVIAGTGPSALDTARSHGTVTVAHNPINGWHDTTSFWRKLKKLARPMTLLWMVVILLVLLSAVRARRHKRGKRPGSTHPYEWQLDVPDPEIEGILQHHILTGATNQ